MSTQYGIDLLAISRVYSLFGESGHRPLYRKLHPHDKDFYNSSIKTLVDNAMARIMRRGLPTPEEIERLKSDIDYFNQGKLGDKTGYYFYKSLDSESEGLYPNARLGDRDSRFIPERQTKSWWRRNISSSFKEDGDTFFSEDRVGDNTPVFKKGEEIVYPVLEDHKKRITGMLLSLPSKKREIAVGESEWYFYRFCGKVPPLEELLEKIEAFLLAVSKSLANFIDALIAYINLIKQRISSIMAFIARIKAIIDLILSLRLPDTNIKYLLTRSRGTLGFVNDLTLAEEQPGSGRGVYSTYATLVFGSGLPQIAEDFILGFFTPLIENEFGQDEVGQI